MSLDLHGICVFKISVTYEELALFLTPPITLIQYVFTLLPLNSPVCQSVCQSAYHFLSFSISFAYYLALHISGQESSKETIQQIVRALNIVLLRLAAEAPPGLVMGSLVQVLYLCIPSNEVEHTVSSHREDLPRKYLSSSPLLSLMPSKFHNLSVLLCVTISTYSSCHV